MSVNSATTEKFSISLKLDMIPFVDQQVASGYNSRSAYIASLIRADKQRQEAKAKRNQNVKSP